MKDFIHNPYGHPELTHFVSTLKAASNKTLFRKPEIDLLEKVFGKERLLRLGKRSYVNIDPALLEKHDPLTKEQISSLFIAAADVVWEDITALYDELKSNREKILYLSEEETANLRGKLNLNQNSPEGLSKTELDILMNVLVPFEQAEDIFLGEKIKLDDKAKSCGKGLLGHKETAYINTYLRCKKDLTFAERAVKIGKRITDREPDPGTVIPDEHGYWVVQTPIFGTEKTSMGGLFEGGAYVIPLKAVSSKSPDFRSCLLCRGTRGNPRAQDFYKTFFDNLRYDQGSDGVIQTYDRVKALVSNPEKGFVTQVDEPLFVMGMSLGGGHAARYAVALFNQVTKTILVCPIGLDDYTLEIYRQMVLNQAADPERAIIRVFDIDDLVPHLGNGHLGRNCPAEKCRQELYCLEQVKDENDAQMLEGQWPAYGVMPAVQSQPHLLTLAQLNTALSKIHVKDKFDDGPVRVYHLSSQDAQLKQQIDQIQDNRHDDRQYFELARMGSLLANHLYLHKTKFADFLARKKIITPLLHQAVHNNDKALFANIIASTLQLFDKQTRWEITNLTDEKGNTILHEICKRGNSAYLQIIMDELAKANKTSKILSHELSHLLDIQRKNSKGQTAIQCAVKNGHVELLNLLFQELDKSLSTVQYLQSPLKPDDLYAAFDFMPDKPNRGLGWNLDKVWYEKVKTECLKAATLNKSKPKPIVISSSSNEARAQSKQEISNDNSKIKRSPSS